MKLGGMRVVMTVVAVCLYSTALFAQMDSSVVLVSSAQTSQPGQPASEQITPPSEQDSSQNAGVNSQAIRDKMFLRGAAESGIALVKFSRLALEKSSSDDVKTLAQTMVDDHTRLNENLGHVADSLGVMVPKEMNKADKAEYAKLQALSGNDFDRAYLALMVKEHHRAMREFRMESNTVEDSSLREAVDSAKHVIHEHMGAVNKLASEKGVIEPEHVHKPEPPPAPPANPPSM